MIILADKSRERELIYLWQQSFGDSEEYIRMFLDGNASEVKIVAYEAERKIVSAAYLIPVTYCCEGKADVPCRYLYAAATLPEHRGRGCFAAILKYIHQYMQEPVILVPGEASLIKYYEKHGFFIWQEKQFLQITMDKEKQIPDTSCFEISAAEYPVKRERILRHQNHMQWNAHFMEYICRENAFCGGKQVQVEGKDFECIVMYRAAEGVLQIPEILLQPKAGIQGDMQNCLQEYLQGSVQALFKETGCKRAEVCLKPCVMATDRLAGKEQGYFNLTMG